MEKNKVLVSACLAGVKCRYNGKSSFNEKILELIKDSEIIIVCPEMLAGEPVPRIACNICSVGLDPKDLLDGADVLAGNAKIIGVDGKDYTENYLKGAQMALEIAVENNIKLAYLKSKSPTCGYGKIYDKNGQNLKIGNGIFAALLIMELGQKDLSIVERLYEKMDGIARSNNTWYVNLDLDDDDDEE